MTQLSDTEIAQFLAAHPGWTQDGNVLARVFKFGAYSTGVGFAVAVSIAAEKRDHHPDIAIGWRRVEVRWSTHDAGGITALDTEMAGLTDTLFVPVPAVA